MSAPARMEWAKDLPFEVKQVRQDFETLDEVDYLFWVAAPAPTRTGHRGGKIEVTPKFPYSLATIY